MWIRVKKYSVGIAPAAIEVKQQIVKGLSSKKICRLVFFLTQYFATLAYQANSVLHQNVVYTVLHILTHSSTKKVLLSKVSIDSIYLGHRIPYTSGTAVTTVLYITYGCMVPPTVCR